MQNKHPLRLYQRLVRAPAAEERFCHAVHEAKAPYCCLQERHVQVMWFEQKYFANLRTITGEPIRILSSGIWNLESGPDFLKAHLLIGDRECRGDIEIHLRTNSWVQHKHHLDHRYNEVVLHLVFWPSKNPAPTVTHDGITIAQAYMEPHLTIPLQRIVQLIDLDLYPYKKFTGSGRCAHELFSKLSEPEIRSFFQEAALYRLQKKAERLQQDLIGGIASALGYKQNAQAFYRLYTWLKEHLSLPPEEMLAACMQACGFFGPCIQEKWRDSFLFRHLKEINQKSITQAPIEKLVLSQIRPLNHPIRRLVYLIHLLADPATPLLQKKITEQWNASWMVLKKHSFLTWLHHLLPDYQDPYWNTHYTFETTPQSKTLPLMGKDLKTEIAVNVILPYLIGEITTKQNHAQELNALQTLYEGIPAVPTNKSRYLSHRFFGNSSRSILLKQAQIMQGTYQLHTDFCVHYEASCAGCPFVDSYKTCL